MISVTIKCNTNKGGGSMKDHNVAKIKKILAKIHKIHEDLPKLKQKRAVKRYFSLANKLKRIENGDL